MNALVVGYGYVGAALGRELLRHGHKVWGVRRSQPGPDKIPQPSTLNPQPLWVAADITNPSTFSALPTGCDWVVNCTAAGGGAAEEYRRLYLEGNRNLAAWLAKAPPKKFLYTSSTGVYTQTDGATVDETTPLLPSAGTARVLAMTERLLLDSARSQGLPAVILRVAGIYGPGRGYWLKQFLAGTAEMEGDGSRRLNMIHQDDVVGAILSALERGASGEVYNAVDDDPPTQRMVFEWLAARLNQPLPPCRTAPPKGESRRGITDKIVSNRKLRSLGWQLQYPTFREGFEAELKRMAEG